MIAINIITEDIPGSAETNPSIVLRKRGAKDKARKTLNIRNARKTENPSDIGAREILITKKSNKFHGSLKKRNPTANSFKINSITKIVKQILSTNDKLFPYFSIIIGDVSIPNVTALSNIIANIEYLTFAVLSHSKRLFLRLDIFIFIFNYTYLFGKLSYEFNVWVP